MAKPSWITLDINSGSGNKSVNVTAAAHTGRLQRTGSLTVKTNGSNGSSIQTKTVALTQNAAAVQVTAGADQEVEAAGTSATVVFTTNAEKFTLEATDGVTVGAVTVNSAAVTPKTGTYAPNGDPGADALYTVSVAVSFAANTTIYQKDYEVTFTDASTNAATHPNAVVSIAHAAADSNLSVSPTSLTFVAAGETKQFTITSNDSWTIA